MLGVKDAHLLLFCLKLSRRREIDVCVSLTAKLAKVETASYKCNGNARHTDNFPLIMITNQFPVRAGPGPAGFRHREAEVNNRRLLCRIHLWSEKSDK